MSTALFAAVASADHIRAKFLLNRGVRINLKDPDGESILVKALRINHDRKRYKMFKWLLSQGANIMTISKTSGRDILIWAAYLNRPAEAVIVLDEAGGELDLRRKDFKGNTALHYGTMNDCSDLLEGLCNYMRKFDISVDQTNSEGLTPYLLARRLGYNTCARVLLEIGEACPHKGDEKTGQSQHFWETLGAIERNRKEDAEKIRVVALYKRMGRMPQLKKAGFDTDHIKLVSSEHEKKVIADGRILQRHGTLAPLNLSSFDPNEPIISSRINTDKPDRIPPTMLINIHQQLEKDSLFANDQEPKDSHQNGDEYMATPRMMNNILDLLSVQGTHSFKPSAMKPRPRGSMVGAAHATAFGLRLKRKAAGKKSRKEPPGSAINKDHLPIIVQN